MNKNGIALFILIAVFYASTTSAGVFMAKIQQADECVTKAFNLQKVNMNSGANEQFQKADKLINEAILNDPNNARLHYEAGVVYVRMGWTSSANDRFDAIRKLGSREYLKKIATPYKENGDKALNGRNWNEAKNNYLTAISYDEDQRGVISNSLFEKGKKDTQNAENYFTIVSSVDGALNGKIAEYYFQKSQQAKDDSSLYFLELAAKYDGQYQGQAESFKKSVGDGYLQKAKDLSKIYGKEKEAERYRSLAEKYLGRELVDKEVPEYVRLYPGTTTKVYLDKDEQSPWFITVGGRTSGVKTLASNEKFKIINDDGTEIEAWKPESKGKHESRDQKWKYVAVEPVFIKVVVN